MVIYHRRTLLLWVKRCNNKNDILISSAHTGHVSQLPDNRAQQQQVQEEDQRTVPTQVSVDES